MENNTIIEITQRKCSDKIQPIFAVGERFFVCATESKGNRNTLVVRHPKRKKSTIRCSSDRFSWKSITLDQLKEEKFKKESEESFNEIRKNFTFEEHMMIAFVPTIIAELAWIYAEKTLKYAADNRISETKKLCRAVKEVRAEYLDFMAKDLDRAHITHIQTQTNKFMEECSRDFTILWFTVNQELKKKFPDLCHIDMRTDAFISEIFCRCHYEHNKRMSDVIRKKLGHAQHAVNSPHLNKLHTCMDAFVSDGNGKSIEYNHHIELCIKIFEKNLNRIEFNLN